LIASFLWTGLSFGEWLAQVIAQAIVAFLFIGICLAPLSKRALAFWRSEINPFTPGGAGDALTADGRPVHEVLTDRLRQP
jgi:hypothetical protein